MEGKVSLEELRTAKQQYDELFPVGTQVILHGLGAGWWGLNTLSAVVVRLETDPLWSHTVRLDYPFLLTPSEEYQSGVSHGKDKVCGRRCAELLAYRKSYPNGPIDFALAPQPWGGETTLHGSTLVKPEHVSVSSRYAINKGYGLVLSDEQIAWAKWLRMWGWVSSFAGQDLRHGLAPWNAGP